MFNLFRKRQPRDATLIEAHKLGRSTMIDPSRIYFWSLSHQVDLKANKKRLKAPGVLSYCVFTGASIEQGEEFMKTPRA